MFIKTNVNYYSKPRIKAISKIQKLTHGRKQMASVMLTGTHGTTEIRSPPTSRENTAVSSSATQTQHPCVASPPHRPVLPHQQGVLPFDSTPQEPAQGPQVKGGVPQDSPHFWHQSQAVGPQLIHSSCLTWLRIRGSQEPQRWEKQLAYYCQFATKDVLKDKNEQPDEEIPRARAGRVRRAGASVPTELGGTTILACRFGPPSGSSPNPVL